MKQTKPNKDIVTIGNKWTGEDRPSLSVVIVMNLNQINR